MIRKLSGVLFACVLLLSGSGAQNVFAQSVNAAEIIHVAGDVTVKSVAAKAWAAAEVGMQVKEGDTIRTGPASKAELAFGKDLRNIISVFPNSQLTVSAFQPGLVHLTEGRVFTLIGRIEKGSTFEVRTPTAVAGARGTGWETAIQRKEAQTTVKGFERKIYVAGLDENGNLIGRKNITAGFKSVIRKHKSPGAARRLDRAETRQWKQWKSSAERHTGAFRKLNKRTQKPAIGTTDIQTSSVKEALSKREPVKIRETAINKVDLRPNILASPVLRGREKQIERKVKKADDAQRRINVINRVEKRLISTDQKKQERRIEQPSDNSGFRTSISND
ncbi:MAG: FecR family protein [Candidatus Omnitrophota bacterium]